MRAKDYCKDALATERQHNASMQQGSALLRTAILRHLREREERLHALTRRNDEAREAIKRRVRPEIVREAFGLSATAYSQLVGQVRA